MSEINNVPNLVVGEDIVLFYQEVDAAMAATRQTMAHLFPDICAIGEPPTAEEFRRIMCGR